MSDRGYTTFRIPHMPGSVKCYKCNIGLTSRRAAPGRQGDVPGRPGKRGNGRALAVAALAAVALVTATGLLAALGGWVEDAVVDPVGMQPEQVAALLAISLDSAFATRSR